MFDRRVDLVGHLELMEVTGAAGFTDLKLGAELDQTLEIGEAPT